MSIRPKALQLLQILIENRPKAMAQEELYDPDQPLESNDTPAGRALNRRVEITLSR
ncbi:MAG TPA: hypothetical protein VER58_10840 [Thermoanaerobaculia bacterium]|nr:hypothetical protein [Thermoanaerobaculia bacterium]